MDQNFGTRQSWAAAVIMVLLLGGCQSSGSPPQTVSDSTRTRLSQALLASGDEANAAEALRTPESREAELAPSALTNAEILIDAGQPDRGMKVATTALATRGDDPEFALQVASLAVKADRLSEARDIYGKILRSHADNVGALNGQGVVLAQQGDLTGAAKSLHSALALKPEDVAARGNMALVMLLSGQNETALSLFEELDKSSPSPQVEAALALARQRVHPGKDAG
jgi:tight adherence protein D